MIEKIIKTVADKYQITVEDITSRKRDFYTAKARRIAIYLCVHETKFTYSTIGLNFGKRDAVSIINACQWVLINIKNYPEINEIKAVLNLSQ